MLETNRKNYIEKKVSGKGGKKEGHTDYKISPIKKIGKKRMTKVT